MIKEYISDVTPKTKPLPIKKQRTNPWQACEICEFKPNRSRQRLDHLATHYRDKIELNLLACQGNFCCPVCEKIQTSKGKLYQHYTRMHRIGEIFLADDIAAGRVKDLKQLQNNSSELAKNDFEENINVDQVAEVTETTNTALSISIKNVMSVEVTKDAVVTKNAKNTNDNKFLEVTTDAIAIDAQLTTAEQSKPHSATQSEISKTTGTDIYHFTEPSLGSKSPLKGSFKNSRAEVSQETKKISSTSHDDRNLLESGSGNSEQQQVQDDTNSINSNSHGQRSSATTFTAVTNPQLFAVRIYCSSVLTLNVLDSSSIWMCQILNTCFYFL